MNAAAAYANQQKVQQNEQIAAHLPLVKRIALHLLARLPSSVELDDLQQAGLLGLLSAVRSYSPDQGPALRLMPAFVSRAPCSMNSGSFLGTPISA